MRNNQDVVLALQKWERASKTQSRNKRDRRLVLPSPDSVTGNLLRFLLRRTGKPLYQTKVAFNRKFLPKIPREMRPNVINWFAQMTTEEGRFFADDSGILCDKRM